MLQVLESEGKGKNLELEQEKEKEVRGEKSGLRLLYILSVCEEGRKATTSWLILLIEGMKGCGF